MDLIKQLIQRFFDDQVMDLSAQCAYYFLLSLFPFLLFIVTLFGFLPIHHDDVLYIVYEYAPERTAIMIENNLQHIMNQQNTGILSFGILFTIWSASHAINSIIRALNKAYRVKKPRPFWRARLVSIFLTFGMILVIMIALVLMVFGEWIGLFLYEFLWFDDKNLFVWESSRFIIGFVILNLIFMLLYYLGPNTRLQFKEILIGSVVATVGWQLTSLGFSYYVNNIANLNATYGSLAGVIVLMLWFHLSAMILIIGGELNASIKELYGK